MATETITTTTTFEEQKVYVTRAKIQLKVKPGDYAWHTEVVSPPIKSAVDGAVEEALIKSTKEQTTNAAMTATGLAGAAAAAGLAGAAAITTTTTTTTTTAVNAPPKQLQEQRFIPVLFKEITKKTIAPIVSNFMEAERYHTEYNKWLSQMANEKGKVIYSTNV